MPPDGRPRKTKRVERKRMSEAAPRGPSSRKEDWITLQFRRVYDDALHDDVPREMMDLLNELDEKDKSLVEDEEPEEPDRGGQA